MLITLDTLEFKVWLRAAQAQSPWVLSMTQRGQWIKVIRETPEGNVQEMPFCFVDRTTGDIYRAANWRFPAKNYIRGNILDATGTENLTPDGISFLKAGCPKGFKYEEGARKTPVRIKKVKPEGADFVDLPNLIGIPIDPPFVPYPAPKLPVRVRHESDVNFWGLQD